MRLGLVGALALAGLAVHGANHVLSGTPLDLLWACNVATLLLAGACFFESPRLVAIATMWLCFGTPMWILDLATGGVVMWTSSLTHFGALGLGLYATWRLGVPHKTWAWATAGLVGVMLVTRYATPPALNINLAHAVWAGWESTFPRYDVYFAAVVSGFAATFFIVEQVFAALAARRPSPPRS